MRSSERAVVLRSLVALSVLASASCSQDDPTRGEGGGGAVATGAGGGAELISCDSLRTKEECCSWSCYWLAPSEVEGGFPGRCFAAEERCPLATSCSEGEVCFMRDQRSISADCAISYALSGTLFGVCMEACPAELGGLESCKALP